MSPALYEQRIDTPTVPTINIGPLIEQNDINLFASWVSMCPLSYIEHINFAPIGYPEMIDKKKITVLQLGVW